MSSKAAKSRRASQAGGGGDGAGGGGAPADEAEAKRREGISTTVDRAMVLSQLEVARRRRLQYVARRAELEGKVEEAAAGRSDIVGRLQQRVAKNYEDMSIVEAKIAEEHVAREAEERRLQDVVNGIEAARASERARCEARRRDLEATLTDLKAFLSAKATHEAELEALHQRVADSDVRHAAELKLLQDRLEQAADARRRETMERITAARAAAVEQLGQQLGARAVANVQENKRLASELRFQCLEVERLDELRSGLEAENEVTLAEIAQLAATAEALAQTTTQMQAAIRDMRAELSIGGGGDDAAEGSSLYGGGGGGGGSTCGSPLRTVAEQDSVGTYGSAGVLAQLSTVETEAPTTVAEATYRRLALLPRDERSEALQLLRRLRQAEATAAAQAAEAGRVRASMEAEAERQARRQRLRDGLVYLARAVVRGGEDGGSADGDLRMLHQQAWPLTTRFVPPVVDADSGAARAIAASILDALGVGLPGGSAVEDTATDDANVLRLPAIASSTDDADSCGAQQQQQQHIGGCTWDEALAAAVRVSRRRDGDGTCCVGTQTLTYRELQQSCAGAHANANGIQCACCGARAARALARAAATGAERKAGGAKGGAATSAAAPGHGYRSLSMVILDEGPKDAATRKLMRSPFPPRQSVRERHQQAQAAAAVRGNVKAAFVSQRGASLAGTSVADGSSAAWSSTVESQTYM